MKSLLVYPFCREFSDFVRCIENLAEYDKVIPIAPKGFGIENEDASICDGGDELNVRVSSDFDAGIEQADGVFFGHTVSNIAAQSYMKKLNKAIALNKKVFLTKELMDFLGASEELEQAEIMEYTKSDFEDKLTLNLLPIKVPVVIVIGVGDYCDKFSIQLKLRDYMSGQGYQVMNFGSKNFSQLFGVEALPQFLMEPMDNTTKIKKLNAYIYNRVIAENPEVVVIGVPGGIMQLNPFRFDEFGEMAYIISNAVKADLSILSIYKQEYTREFIEHLINICKYRYNFHVNYINVANTDLFISPDVKVCQYTTITSDYIIKNIINRMEFDDVFIFNALNDTSMKDACAKILNELENNI